MYMQMVLEVSMRKEFDETLGEIDYIASKRKNALMISIPMNDELLLISVNPKSSTEEIVAKAIKVFKDSEESDGVEENPSSSCRNKSWKQGIRACKKCCKGTWCKNYNFACCRTNSYTTTCHI